MVLMTEINLQKHKCVKPKLIKFYQTNINWVFGSGMGFLCFRLIIYSDHAFGQLQKSVSFLWTLAKQSII